MKNIFLSFIILNLALLFSSSSYANCRLVVGIENHPPFVQKNKEHKWQGLSIKLAERFAKQAKCKLIYKQLPWRRALHLLELGKIDLLLDMSFSDQRSMYTNFVGPIRKETLRLVVEKSSDFKVQNLDDLKQLPFSVGIVMGGFYGPYFNHKIKTDPEFAKKIYYASSAFDQFEKFKKQRISSFIFDQQQLKNIPEALLNSNSYKLLDYKINTSGVYLGFSKKSISKDLLLKLRKAFSTLSSQGAFKKIIKENDGSLARRF